MMERKEENVQSPVLGGGALRRVSEEPQHFISDVGGSLGNEEAGALGRPLVLPSLSLFSSVTLGDTFSSSTLCLSCSCSLSALVHLSMAKPRRSFPARRPFCPCALGFYPSS